MSQAVGFVATIVAVTLWLAGVVLAQGLWSTVAAIWFPPYAWYLVVERAMVMAGILSAGGV